MGGSIEGRRGRESGYTGFPARGSVSVFFALIFTVMVSLILAEITSAKVQAGRAQAANVMDLAMDSLFAHYDRESAELFGLYYLYTGHGGGPDPSGCISLIGECADELFKPSALKSAVFGSRLLELSRQNTALTSYALITDAYGTLFREMASEAERDTGGADLFSRLTKKASGSSKTADKGADYLEKSENANYSDVKALSAEAQREASALSNGAGSDGAEGQSSGSTGTEPSPGTAAVPDDFVNPLPVLERIRKGGILELVLPEGKTVSGESAHTDSFVSKRSLATGVGIVDASGTSSSNALFRAWIWTHFGNFTEPSAHSALSCQTEYILAGKSSDRENLKKVVKKLLLIREAVNIYCLYTDTEKSAELKSLSAIIAAALLIPEAAELIRLVLAAGWAYAESVVDVRALLEGKKVAASKSASTWQTDAEKLAKSGGNLSGLTKDAPSGMTYQDYLGILLMSENIRNETMRSMDMTESELQGRGRAEFRLDSCMVAMTAEMTVLSENLVAFPVTREQSYLESSETG